MIWGGAGVKLWVFGGAIRYFRYVRVAFATISISEVK